MSSPARELREGLDDVAAHIAELTRERNAALDDLARVRSLLPDLIDYLIRVEVGSIHPVAQRAKRWRAWLAACLPDESDREV